MAMSVAFDETLRFRLEWFMTIEQLLAGVDARLTRLEAEIRATPRRGPVTLSDGTRVGHARRLNNVAWGRIRADWARQYPCASPADGRRQVAEAVAA